MDSNSPTNTALWPNSEPRLGQDGPAVVQNLAKVPFVGRWCMFDEGWVRTGELSIMSSAQQDSEAVQDEKNKESTQKRHRLQAGSLSHHAKSKPTSVYLTDSSSPRNTIRGALIYCNQLVTGAVWHLVSNYWFWFRRTLVPVHPVTYQIVCQGSEGGSGDKWRRGLLEVMLL